MFGIDYAFNPHSSPAAIKTAGAGFVCRYISAYAPNDSNGKNLLAGELQALRATGLSIVLVAEEGGQRMLGGHAAGVADAQHADAVAKALRMSGIPIYFACDWDAAPADQTAINAYLDGAASVIGHARTGIYGGYWPVTRARAAGKASYFWGTPAWSAANWHGVLWPHIMQGGQVNIGGATVDTDQAMQRDYGQWPRPGTPVPPPVATGPYRHVVPNSNPPTLAAVAASRKTTVTAIADLSRQNMSPQNDAVMNAYLALDGALFRIPRRTRADAPANGLLDPHPLGGWSWPAL